MAIDAFVMPLWRFKLGDFETGVERLAGEGKWWATKERWGGGPGGEVEDTTSPRGPSGIEEAPGLREKSTPRNVDGSRVRRRPTPAQLWKTVKPGNPLWDPKVVYEAIGKATGAYWDYVGYFTSHI